MRKIGLNWKSRNAVFELSPIFRIEVWYKKHPGQRMFLCLLNVDNLLLHLRKKIANL